MKPVVERISRTEVIVAWPALSIGCAFARLRESDNGVIRAELTIESSRPDCPGILGGPTLVELLRSGPEIQRLSTALANRTDGQIPWPDILAGAVRHVLLEWRTPPEPVEWADMEAPAAGTTFLFDQFIPRNQTTALMADQRSGKSTLGLAIAISTITGVQLPCGWRPEATGPVLYLDWETDEASIYGMLTEIQNGLRLAARPRGFHYLRMNGPLINQAQAIQSIVGRLKPMLVIVDSLGWAAGGDLNKTEVAIPTMDTLASFPATRLVLAHYSKSHRENGQGSASIYGNGFFEFACRGLWELRKESDAGSAFNIGLYNRKLSRGREGASMAVRLSFDGSRNAVEVLPARIEQSPELANKLPMHARIRQLLEAGPMDTDELAEQLSIGREIAVKSNAVRSVITRMPDVVNVGPSQEGRGNHQLWVIQKPQQETATNRNMLRFSPSRLPYQDDIEDLPL